MEKKQQRVETMNFVCERQMKKTSCRKLHDTSLNNENCNNKMTDQTMLLYILMK